MENLIKTNIFSYVMMTKHFIAECKLHREFYHRSYIIYLSSVVADIRNPFTTAFYQSSKLQNKIFAKLVYYPKSIDYLIIKPGWVSTSMTKHKKVDKWTASLEEEVPAIFNSIGWTRETYA